ncbi:MAG: RnfABCDGE type electron transport complex subunit G [Bacillota bacterium]|nr:RnfABCDGE type electron transport complex subunit G [Bacillota bacterium]
MREQARVVIVLTLVSLVAGAALAYTYEATLPRIRANEAEARQEALKDVVPGTARFTPLTVKVQLTGAGGKPEARQVEVYQCLDASGNLVGLAYIAEPVGFADTIRLMVGLDPAARRILAIRVLDLKETPGLGVKVREEKFTGQFKGKNLADPFVAARAGSDLQAVTGATISSKAVARGVKESAEAVLAAYAQEEGGRT